MAQCGTVWCSVVPCVVVWFSVLQCSAVCCGVLRCVAVCCSVLQCAKRQPRLRICDSMVQCGGALWFSCAAAVVQLWNCVLLAVYCSVLKGVAVSCCSSVAECVTSTSNRCPHHAIIQYVAVCCSVLHLAAACCSMLQYVAVCCRVMQYMTSTSEYVHASNFDAVC